MKLARATAIASSTILSGLLACCVSKPSSRPRSAGEEHVSAQAHVRARAYLNMPCTSAGAIPALLSQTGAFADVRTLTPAAGLVPYEVNVSFWSDGATKQRWIALPATTADKAPAIGFAPSGPWTFPGGTVFVKHFEMPTGPSSTRRLETRLLVRDALGGVYGVTYRWRADNSDADRIDDREVESVASASSMNHQNVQWTYPGRVDCLSCHTAVAGGVLGVNARQLNRSGADHTNQLAEWSGMGLFNRTLQSYEIGAAERLVPATDPRADLEQKARSYLDANCVQCHQPGGAPGMFDARISTPLEKQNLLDGPVLINLGLDHARVIAPNDPSRSVLLARVSTTQQPMMPPLAHSTLDTEGIALVRTWIQSLPGPNVVDAPTLKPAGGTFAMPVRVTLGCDDPAAEIRYTLDGSAPTAASPVYQQPLELTASTTVRARAFRDGFTRSIVAQDTYEIGN